MNSPNRYTNYGGNAVQSASQDIYSSSSGKEPKKIQSKKRHKQKKPKKLIAFVAVSLTVLIGILFILNIRPLKVAEETNPDLKKIVTSDHGNVSYFLVCGLDLSEELTDIMMVVCFDHKKNKASILQIPRDTYTGTDVPSAKMNAVYGSPQEGESNIKALIRRINSQLGLPIDHYVCVTIEGFRDLVDAVDGVTIYLENEILVPDVEKERNVTLGPGKEELTGSMAEGFMRHRQGYTMGDLDRMRAQRRFFAGFAQKMLNMGITQMIKAATTAFDDITTDLSIGEMISYVNKVSNLDMDDISIYGLPGQAVDSYVPEGFSTALSYYSIHTDEYIQLANSELNPYGSEITAEDVNMREIYDVYYENQFTNDKTTFSSFTD